MKISAIVPDEYIGLEIKSYMRRELHMSSQMIKRVKMNGTVNINGEHRNVTYRFAPGDSIYIEYGTPPRINKTDIPVLYEDEHIIVVNKPSGIVTHPTHGHLDDSLLTLLSEDTLHPVMRLDRETSGILMVAKDGHSHFSMLERGNLQKKYLALCYGRFEPSEGRIDLPIKRREGSVMIRDCAPDGKESITLYRTVFYDEETDVSLMEYKLLTGRCHQIRTHSMNMGHPLIGDGLYGPNSVDNPSGDFPRSSELDSLVGRLALHAYYLKFYNPFSGEDIELITDIPEEFRRALPSAVALDELLGKLN